MKPAVRVLCIAAVAALLLPVAAWPDRLEMKDGRVVNGTYLGGSRVNVHFRVDGGTKIYRRADVSAIFLDDEGTPASAPARPAASSSTSASSATPALPSSSSATSSSTASSTRPAATAGGTVPAGTRILVRMIDSMDSDVNKTGDTFRASLEGDLVVNDALVAPRGADVIGRLTEAQEAGHIKGKSQLKLELTQLIVNGQTYPLSTGEYETAGSSRGTDTAKKVGGGAAIGAVIGAIAGGGKGAAIGAGVGAGAGTAIQVFTKGEQVRVPSETLLEFTLEQDLVVKRSTRRR